MIILKQLLSVLLRTVFHYFVLDKFSYQSLHIYKFNLFPCMVFFCFIWFILQPSIQRILRKSKEAWSVFSVLSCQQSLSEIPAALMYFPFASSIKIFTTIILLNFLCWYLNITNLNAVRIDERFYNVTTEIASCNLAISSHPFHACKILFCIPEFMFTLIFKNLNVNRYLFLLSYFLLNIILIFPYPFTLCKSSWFYCILRVEMI